jgi:DNA-binding transcriptional LysR family regulator
MELRHLRYFAAVAEALNFSRAAETLRVAQPALSCQIRNLEEEMGVQLLERNHARVQLTDAGRVFQAHVTKLLAQVDLAVTAAQASARGQNGELIVANDWRLPVDVLSEAILAFRARYPQVEISLAELRLHEQLPALRAGRIHLGFLPRDFIGARDDLELLPVLRSELVAVLPANHRLASHSALRLRELADEKWIWNSEQRAQGLRAFVVQTCRLAGFAPTFGKSAETLEGMLTLVGLGYGVLLLPRLVVPTNDAKLRILPTDCDIVEMCAIWRRDDPSQTLQHFVAILRERLAAVATVAAPSTTEPHPPMSAPPLPMPPSSRRRTAKTPSFARRSGRPAT